MEPVRWRRVCELFDAALARDPAERGGFVAAIEDVELRRELESLLAAHEATGPLDRLAPQMDMMRGEAFSGEAGQASTAERAPTLASGRRLGRHEIRGSIGAGGMGEVYRAYDTRLRRDVDVAVEMHGGGA